MMKRVSSEPHRAFRARGDELPYKEIKPRGAEAVNPTYLQKGAAAYSTDRRELVVIPTRDSYRVESSACLRDFLSNSSRKKSSNLRHRNCRKRSMGVLSHRYPSVFLPTRRGVGTAPARKETFPGSG